MYSRVFVGVKKKERKISREKAQRRKKFQLFYGGTEQRGQTGLLNKKG